MSEKYFDVLREPWINTSNASGKTATLSLAEVLAELGAGNELEFTGLRSHQQQAWYAFLNQLAAMALERAGFDSLDHHAKDWASFIAALDDSPTAFHLVVEDLSQPAFFQPPVPEDSLAKWQASTTPDFLDIRITAKNFDVKGNGFCDKPDVEHWCYALITLQTMQGVSGKYNYGVSRMNRGLGSRAEVGLAPCLGWSSRFRRDVPILLASSNKKRREFGFAKRIGLALVWCRPWRGEKTEALSLPDLDPNYLEICRRIRLSKSSDIVHVYRTTTKATRIDSGEQGSDLGDIWTPIRKKDNAALTLSERGFDYRTVSRVLLTKEYKAGAALEFHEADEQTSLLSLRALARGQGKTGGFHERHILLNSRAIRKPRDTDAFVVADLTKTRLDLASEIERKVLKLALIALVQERVGREDGKRYDLKDQSPDFWVQRLDRHIDRIFFSELFGDLAAGIEGEEIYARWQRCLRGLTESIFEEACLALEPVGYSKYRALSKATSLFRYKLKEALPLAFPENEQPPETASLLMEGISHG